MAEVKLLKVVVADDDRATRRIVASLLERERPLAARVATIEAADGLTAQKIFEANSDIALLVTDLQMPGIGGRELVLWLRGTRAYHDLPVMMISATANRRVIDELDRMGRFMFAAKPLDRKTFGHRIVRMIRAGRESPSMHIHGGR
jgi:CheY-like chemotaxis protein